MKKRILHILVLALACVAVSSKVHASFLGNTELNFTDLNGLAIYSDSQAQIPSGHDEKFIANNKKDSNSSKEPLPVANKSTLVTQVPAPVGFGLLLFGILWLFARDRRAIKK